MNLVQQQRFTPGEFKHRTVRIHVVDQATGPWGHINFAGIYTPAPMTLIRRAEPEAA